MTLLNMYCSLCGKKRLHKEDAVPDSHSATVWHCLWCGHERYPDGGNSMVLAGNPRQDSGGNNGIEIKLGDKADTEDIKVNLTKSKLGGEKHE